MPKMLNFNESLIFKLHEMIHIIDRYAEAAFRDKLNFEYSHFMVLMMVTNCPAFSQKKISENLATTESAVSRWIDKLVKQGLLFRKINPKNRREHILEITDLGSEILEKCLNLVDGMKKDLFSCLEDSDIKIMHNSVDKLLDKLKKNSNIL